MLHLQTVLDDSGKTVESERDKLLGKEAEMTQKVKTEQTLMRMGFRQIAGDLRMGMGYPD